MTIRITKDGKEQVGVHFYLDKPVNDDMRRIVPSRTMSKYVNEAIREKNEKEVDKAIKT